MRHASLLSLLLVLGACQTVAPHVPGRADVEIALADLLASAAAPATDADAFARSVTTSADVTLRDVRALLADVAHADGRFVYVVESYRMDREAGAAWHVLRVAFVPPDTDRVEAEFTFGTESGTLRLERLSPASENR